MKMNHLIAALWLLGLVCALMPVPQLETQFFLISILCIAAASLCALWQVFKSGAYIPKTPLLIVGLLFWLLALNSVLWSDVKFESYLYFWFFSALPLSFLIFTLLHDARLLKIAGLGTYAVLVLLALVNFYFYAAQPEWLLRGQAGWPFADPNALAALMSFGFFASLSGILLSPQKWQRQICLGLALLFFAVLITTGSRAAILALLGGLLLFAACNTRVVKDHKKYAGALAVLGVVMFVLMQQIGGGDAIKPAAMIADTLQRGLGALDTRPAMWHSAWAIIKAHLWTGTGIGTFYLYYPQVRGADYGTAGLHAHNDVLEFASDMGIAAPILFYIFIALAVARTVKAFKNASSETRIKILLPFCALAAMIAHTHVEFNFYVLPTLMVSGFVLAYWMRVTEPAPVAHRIWPPAGVAFAALILGFGLTVFAAAAGSNILIQNAQEASARGDLAAFTADVNAANKLSHQHNAQAYLLAASIPMALIEQQPENRAALIAQAQGLLERAHTLNPRSAAILLQQARLAQLQGDATMSGTLLGQAVVLNPLYLPARIKLAAHQRSAGQKRQAYETLKEGLRWPYDDEAAPAYYDDAARTAIVFGDADTAQLARDMKGYYEGRIVLRANRRTLGGTFSTAM